MRIFNDYARKVILASPAKKIMLSGPSGFLGSRVMDSILAMHEFRKKEGLEPGEITLLSSSPGRLMERLYKKYGPEKMRTVRASRVDYYKQHDVDTWIDQLGSLGVEGDQAVFVNLAAVAGPVDGIPDAMMDVNYRAPMAAAKACEVLGFSHWIQSSTQATNAERAGQVPYSRAKAMMDYALSRCTKMPVSVACLGLLYCKNDGIIGQERTRGSRINMIDLALLPLTPIMGNGTAPLQPMEVTDASSRLAFLAMTDTKYRPQQLTDTKRFKFSAHSPSFMYYDAVGPETMSILDMLCKFAKAQGNNHFRPVFIGYRNMEKLLNVRSLGNLNRQFVSLLRSEQDSQVPPIIGDSRGWETILGEEAKLQYIDDALFQLNEKQLRTNSFRRFPYSSVLNIIYKYPKIALPGIYLSLEILDSYFTNGVLNTYETHVLKMDPKQQMLNNSKRSPTD